MRKRYAYSASASRRGCVTSSARIAPGTGCSRNALRAVNGGILWPHSSPLCMGMEACRSAHYWIRWFREHGHDVRLIALHSRP